jgi:hypothetical protein
MGLLFAMAAGPRQRGQSHVRVPRDSLPHFTVSDSRLPQPGETGVRIYVPKKQGGLIISPGIRSSLHSLGRTQQKTPFPNNHSIAA